MNSLEVNKAFAAVLTAGVAFMVSGFVGSVLISPERPHESAIRIGDPAATQATQAPAAAAPALEPIGALLVNASADRGKDIAQRLCSACHSFNEGGRNGVGPNLYGIVGAPHAHIAGFNYSAANRAMASKPWGYDDLNHWLYKPAEYMPGTRMAFAGISNGQQRADVVAYLRSISPNAPPPPPPPAAAPAAQPAAAAAPAAPQPGGGAPAAQPASSAAGGDIPAVGPLLASADVANGERLARQQCGICHTFNEGGRNGVGPNLYNIIGAPHAHLENFNYSSAFKAKNTGRPWTYEDLNHWLYRPLQYAPGTRMVFAGINDVKQRADIIAYLRGLSPDPKPLP